MIFNFLIAPDFAPERFASWYMLNTYLQKKANIHTHLLMPASAHEQNDLIDTAAVDIIYANPFDAAHLIAEKGYRAVARPKGKSDEMVIATRQDSPILQLEDLQAGCRIALADNHDVQLIGLRLLEAVDLTEQDVEWHIVENYQAAARQIINEKADAAFFLSELYHSFSHLTLSKMRILIESDLSDITHVVLVNQQAQDSAFTSALLSLHEDAQGKAILQELGIPQGFEAMTQEDSEFMLDLMETLVD